MEPQILDQSPNHKPSIGGTPSFTSKKAGNGSSLSGVLKRVVANNGAVIMPPK